MIQLPMRQQIPSISTPLRQRSLVLILLLTSASILYILLFRLGLLMSPRDLPAVLCGDACAPESPLHPIVSEATPLDQALLNESRPLSTLLDNISKEPNLEKISILVEKSLYRLTIFYDLKPLKSYAVVLGENPSGDKFSQGDQKTPEGLLHIRDLYPHPEWSKFVWLDYPNPQSWRKHFQAKLTGEIGLFASIGGEIGIHGVPQGLDILIPQRSNWTLGCVSLRNGDIEEIYPFLKIGTPVEIRP